MVCRLITNKENVTEGMLFVGTPLPLLSDEGCDMTYCNDL
jgi:hypothetical protein